MFFSIFFQLIILLCEAIAVIVVLLIYNLGIFSFSGTAMEPGIYKNDLIIAIRSDLKIPLISYIPAVKKMLSIDHIISRGDIVIFEKGGMYTAKRVVGIPEDKIEIDDYQVSVNGLKMSVDVVGDKLFAETSLNGSSTYYTINEIAYNSKPYQYTVPQESIFCLGDNRVSSLDSRFSGAYNIDSVQYIALFKILNNGKFAKILMSIINSFTANIN